MEQSIDQKTVVASTVTVTTRDGSTYEIPPYDPEQLRIVRAGGRPRGTAATPRQRRRVYKRDGGRCRNCGKALDPDGPWEADHRIPRRRGGPTTMENLQLLCIACNRSKGDKVVSLLEDRSTDEEEG